jgi:DNA repair exonuclease SbcCD ATPase subunit
MMQTVPNATHTQAQAQYYIGVRDTGDGPAPEAGPGMFELVSASQDITTMDENGNITVTAQPSAQTEETPPALRMATGTITRAQLPAEALTALQESNEYMAGGTAAVQERVQELAARQTQRLAEAQEKIYQVRLKIQQRYEQRIEEDRAQIAKLEAEVSAAREELKNAKGQVRDFLQRKIELRLESIASQKQSMNEKIILNNRLIESKNKF